MLLLEWQGVGSTLAKWLIHVPVSSVTGDRFLQDAVV